VPRPWWWLWMGVGWQGCPGRRSGGLSRFRGPLLISGTDPRCGTEPVFDGYCEFCGLGLPAFTRVAVVMVRSPIVGWESAAVHPDCEVGFRFLMRAEGVDVAIRTPR